MTPHTEAANALALEALRRWGIRHADGCVATVTDGRDARCTCGLTEFLAGVGFPDDREPGCDCEPEHVWPCALLPRCDEPGCGRETTCGFPTPTGYRRTCGEHYRAALKGADHMDDRGAGPRLCGCKADTELSASSGCAICGHRDHGRSGCRAALEADR